MERPRNNVLEFNYLHTSGPGAGFSSISNPEKQNEVCELLITGSINNYNPVKVATEAGIPQLTAATGLLYLINEGILEHKTLKLQVQPSNPTSSEV